MFLLNFSMINRVCREFLVHNSRSLIDFSSLILTEYSAPIDLISLTED